MPPPPSRLDDIPDEASMNILRFMSRAPAKVDWISAVHHTDALTTLSLPGAISALARAHFTRLSVGMGGMVCPSGLPMNDMHTIYLPHTDVALLTRWLHAAAATLTSLAFEHSMADRFADDLAAMLETLESGCTSLRRMEISGIGVGHFSRALLRARRGRLVELSARGEHAPDIEKFCGGLRNLLLTDAVATGWGGVLRTVGPTLETLQVIQPWACSEADMNAVRELCPKLTAVGFMVEKGSPVQPYATLLQSYGDQLHFATLGRMPKSLCEAVVEACPNLMCEAELTGDAWVERALVLAPRLKKLRIYVDATADGRLLAEVGERCCALKELQLTTKSARAESAVREVLSGVKPFLASFKLGVVDRGSATEALHALAGRAGTLNELYFFGSLPDTKAFDAIVRGAPDLQKAFIRLHESVEGIAGRDIVQSFVNCNKLRELTVNGSLRHYGRILSHPNGA